MFYVENDPGIPLGEWDDPIAGLVRDAGKAIMEGKAIGSFSTTPHVSTRDQVMRYHPQGQVSYHIRQASRNANRDLAEVYETVEEQIGGLLSRWIEGKISISKLRAESSDWWRRAYERSRDIGRKASAIERLHPQAEVLAEEETWFRGAVREELRYWNLFLEEMLSARRGQRFDEGRMWDRFAAYTKALRFMYEASRVQALPDNMLFYWMGPKPVAEDPKQKGHICRGCTWMVEHSPFTKSTLPAVPRDGSTACLTNCRHRMVVRVAHPMDIARRERQLGSKQTLIRKLREQKVRAHGTWRETRAKEVAKRLARNVSNPFVGQRLPANPRPHQGVPRPDERRPLTEAELFLVPMEHRLHRIEEDINSDMALRHVDLYYTARQLESALSRGKIEARTLQPLLDRFVGALEAVVFAANGRSEAQRFAGTMRAAISRLWQAVDRAGLSESDAGLVLGAAAGVL